MAPAGQHLSPRNASDSDFSFMDPNDPLSISLLASNSSELLWPGVTGDRVPGHLTPGAVFVDHCRSPYPADTLGVDSTTDSCNLDHSVQLSHKDWSTRGTRHMHTHQLAEQPYMMPDFIRQSITPFFDTPVPSPPPINPHNEWMDIPSPLVESFNICSSAGITPWNGINSHFDIQSIIPSLYEGPSDTNHKCGWSVDGLPCNKYYRSSGNLKHSVSRHLSEEHSLLPADGKSVIRCLWMGCAKVLKRESIVRHIVAVHLHITTACEACGTSFARQDSLQRHMRNSCGASAEKQ